MEKRIRVQVLLETCGGMWMAEKGEESNLSKANMSWTEADDGRETNKQKQKTKNFSSRTNQWIKNK